MKICYEKYQGSSTQYHFADIGQLTAFKGINNVWSDLNGDVTVQYWR